MASKPIGCSQLLESRPKSRPQPQRHATARRLKSTIKHSMAQRMGYSSQLESKRIGRVGGGMKGTTIQGPKDSIAMRQTISIHSARNYVFNQEPSIPSASYSIDAWRHNRLYRIADAGVFHFIGYFDTEFTNTRQQQQQHDTNNFHLFPLTANRLYNTL